MIYLKYKKSLAGFTLIELMVVLFMVSILTAILLSSSFKNNKIRAALLNDLDNITLLIRDMQSRTVNFVSDDNVGNIGYGVFFDKSDKTTNFQVQSFFKTVPNIFYTSELSNSPSPKIILNYGDYISNICLNNSCQSGYTVDKMAVYFIKPKQNIKFSVYNGNSYVENIPNTAISISSACIEISSPDNKEKRNIYLSYVGQISFSVGACK